jgi:hypothetical protein
MEVMVGADYDLESATRSFLNSFDVAAVDEQIAQCAVSLRCNHRIKLPDAIIWATAQVPAMPFVTRSATDFPIDDPGIRAPYKAVSGRDVECTSETRKYFYYASSS